MFLTKHEQQTFQNQTIYVTGQAFVGCTFINCTLVFREGLFLMEQCNVQRCNWHIDRVVMWGNPESIKELVALVDIIRQNHEQQVQPAPEGTTPTAEAGATETEEPN